MPVSYILAPQRFCWCLERRDMPVSEPGEITVVDSDVIKLFYFKLALRAILSRRSMGFMHLG